MNHTELTAELIGGTPIAATLAILAYLVINWLRSQFDHYRLFGFWMPRGYYTPEQQAVVQFIMTGLRFKSLHNPVPQIVPVSCSTEPGEAEIRSEIHRTAKQALKEYNRALQLSTPHVWAAA